MCSPKHQSLVCCLLAANVLLAFAESRGADPDARVTLTVKGLVVDEHERPIAGVKVESISNTERSGAVSTKDGTFTLKSANVRNWGLTLVASTESGDQQAFFEQYDVKKVPDEVRLTLRPARELVASIVDGDQRPVAGATLRAMTNSFKSVGVAASDAAGKVRLLVPKDAALQNVYAVKPDVGLDYFIYRPREANGRPDNPFALAPDHDQPLEFVLNGTRTVTVRVADDHDKPLVELPVYAWYFEKPKKGEHLNISGVSDFNLQTDKQGRAVFRTIPADNVGKVTFWAHHKDYFTPERPMFDPSSGINELKATLLPRVPVKGTVTFADGRPAADAEITVAGSGYTFDSFHGATRSGADGTFEILVNPDHFCLFAAKLDRQASAAETRVVRLREPVEGIQLSLQSATRVYGTMTVGKDVKPVPNQYVQLYLQPNPDYYRLPEAERLPNPRDDRRAIMPVIVQNSETDANGKYEFFAGPGKYYMIRAQPSDQPPKFELTDDKDFEVNFHSELPNLIDFQGRVVRETVKKRDVAETQVAFAGFEPRATPWQAITDKTGQFRTPRTPCEMLLYAESNGGLLAGITRLEPEDATGEISLAPTAAVRGRIIDSATGVPVAGLEIRYGIEVKHPQGSTSERFGGTADTDAAGEFVATGLVPGWEYKLYFVNARDSEGNARQWNSVGIVAPERPECVDAGDFRINAPAGEALDALIQRAFQSQKPHTTRFERALADSQLGQKRLLMVLAGKDAPPLVKFFAVYYNRAEKVGRRDDLVEALRSFAVLAVDPAVLENDPHARAWAERLKITRPDKDQARFIVFENDGAENQGRLVVQIGDTELSAQGKFDLGRLIAFLTEHARPLPDAEQVYAEAQAQAQRDDKRVLLVQIEQFSASSALLARWLQANRDLLARDYVVVTVAENDDHADRLIRRIRGGLGSTPWLAICDASAKTLATSDGPEDNVSYPVNAAGCRHFERMFRKTVRHLTEADVQTLMERLE